MQPDHSLITNRQPGGHPYLFVLIFLSFFPSYIRLVLFSFFLFFLLFFLFFLVVVVVVVVVALLLLLLLVLLSSSSSSSFLFFFLLLLCKGWAFKIHITLRLEPNLKLKGGGGALTRFCAFQGSLLYSRTAGAALHQVMDLMLLCTHNTGHAP